MSFVGHIVRLLWLQSLVGLQGHGCRFGKDRLARNQILRKTKQKGSLLECDSLRFVLLLFCVAWNLIPCWSVFPKPATVTLKTFKAFHACPARSHHSNVFLGAPQTNWISWNCCFWLSLETNFTMFSMKLTLRPRVLLFGRSETARYIFCCSKALRSKAAEE